MGDWGCPAQELGTSSSREVLMKWVSLAMRTMALPCTAGDWELVKGSRSWEEKSC